MLKNDWVLELFPNNVILKNECDGIVWTGDINADFYRDTLHCKTVKAFVEQTKFNWIWKQFSIAFTWIYEREGISYISVLDHLLVSESFNGAIADDGVIHHPDNSSDHSPIYCILDSFPLAPSSSQAIPPPPHPSWKQDTDGEKKMYKSLIKLKLNAIIAPTMVTECRDLHCKDEIHLEAVDFLLVFITFGVRHGNEKLGSP